MWEVISFRLIFPFLIDLGAVYKLSRAIKAIN